MSALGIIKLPPTAVETFRGVVFPWHCDLMGHFATQHYMPLFDGAIHHLLARLAPLVEEHEGRRLGWADVRHTIDYRAEVRAGDLLILKSIIVRLGTTSVTHRTYVCRLPDEEVCSILDAVTVRFDLNARKPSPISDSIRAAAMNMLARESSSNESARKPCRSKSQ